MCRVINTRNVQIVAAVLIRFNLAIRDEPFAKDFHRVFCFHDIIVPRGPRMSRGFFHDHTVPPDSTVIGQMEIVLYVPRIRQDLWHRVVVELPEDS